MMMKSVFQVFLDSILLAVNSWYLFMVVMLLFACTLIAQNAQKLRCKSVQTITKEAYFYIQEDLIYLCNSSDPNMFLSHLDLLDPRRQEIKVSRSRSMKQKIDEILTSQKIQTNSIILYNCIGQICLCFDRLLLLDLTAG